MNKASRWIWHYGDYEIYHTMKANLRRQEFGADYPIFWKGASPYTVVRFVKEFEGEGYMIAHTNGKGYIVLDGVRYMMNTRIEVPSGKHSIYSVIFKTDGLPALYVESDVCPSDKSWLCNHNAGKFTPVGCEKYFADVDKNPEVFPFEYERKKPISAESADGGILYDFGTELFGFLNIGNADREEKMGVFYGESKEEAIDTEHSLIFEYVNGKSEYRLVQRAFRYIYIKTASEKLDISMDYEYLPLEQKGYFECDNELFNKIYNVCIRTFHLNCREGFLDGIKRDRWIWGGDAYQSARINGYLFADSAIVRRSTIGLIGKSPVEQHINTIVDYSLLWIIGLYEYYMTYGDIEFLKRIFPMATELMDFCETRLNEHGFIVGNGDEGDWTFIDWSEIDKTGAVCGEQMLLAKSYSVMAFIAELIGADSKNYGKKSDTLKVNINKFYWNNELGAYIDSYESGKNNVTRHANIFAVMYDIASPEQVESILKNVLKNDNITKITTPYFEGYELDVLGKLGELGEIEDMLASYWGRMLELGADTIWEEFDPSHSGAEHYAMYGSKYAKSLCHAWGAAPVYLFGRYYLGVYPTSAGYGEFNAEPRLGGLNEIKGTVPINGGEVRILLNKKRLCITATKSGGTLIWSDKKYALKPKEELVIDF